MKKKVLDDLKTKSLQDLKKKLLDLEKGVTNELLELRMGRTQNVHAASNIKKDIARVKTIIKLKNITEMSKDKSDKKEQKEASTPVVSKQIGSRENATS